MTADDQPLRFAWLEITGRCQLRCVHCYAESGPAGNHGAMSGPDWRQVIDAIAGLGARTVQFIGGEPTTHPSFAPLVQHASSAGLEVEVFSNLVRIRPEWWELFRRCDVSLATSCYSDDRTEHETITARRGSHPRTRANVAEAIGRGIPLRVGIVAMDHGQRVDQARRELEDLGVASIAIDRLRHVGRGVRGDAPDVAQLCGQCAGANIAISPNGTVWPCVFSRWLPVGNVRRSSLPEILRDRAISAVRARLTAHFEARAACLPNMCDPQCGPSCSPACRPAGNCRPSGGCMPSYG